ncbi:RnfABCDGE type electron transport complex subunit G [Halorhodospira neutriphila]|uniref:Ion-translocating oxidoreductase complex subunit G n=1 Tax=Halorhodospira neutriphila TaxID=168379 RepID=A0ABS1E6E1_9GAMM|nr:RnfABCDGE type electron transport complex subunit G [Halorhodospira neutriphila]MBK1727308.1 hypothetical protein [Halorhodospira neutriphila]
MTLPAGIRAGLVLAGFVGAGLTLVGAVHEATEERIAAAERQVVLDRLEAVLPPGYDNEPAEAAYERPAPLGDGPPMRIYPAYGEGRYLGAAVEVTAPEGYAGPIRLLIGVRADGRVVAVRPVRHQETPGLGDAIEAGRSDWIRSFNGHRLGEPPRREWRVAADGGAFDAITGATITSRAVVDAVRAVLLDFESAPGRYRAQRSAGGEAAP